MATPQWKIKAAQQIFKASRVKGNATHLKVDVALSIMFHLDCFKTPLEIVDRLRGVITRDLDYLAKQLDLLTRATSESAYKVACSLLEEQTMAGECYGANRAEKTAQGGV